MKKEKNKQTLKLTLLLMDIIVLLAIFFGVIFLFEFVIKDILVKYSVNKFFESMRTAQFDLSNAINYIDEKKELPYEENVDKVFDYLKLSTLKRSKYDNSLFITVFPKDENKIIAGKRNNLNLKFNLKDVSYDVFNEKINELSSLKNDKNNKKQIINFITFNFQGRDYIGDANSARSVLKRILTETIQN